MKRRKDYRKKNGHRAQFTQVEVKQVIDLKKQEDLRMAHKKGVGSSKKAVNQLHKD